MSEKIVEEKTVKEEEKERVQETPVEESLSNESTVSEPTETQEESQKTKESEKKEEKPKEVIEERVYTFRLGKIYTTTRKKRASRAVRYIRSRLERHLKKPIKISPEVNSVIWARGAEKPVRKITVKTLIYEDEVLVVSMR